MAELGPKEQLQPSLLDRLTDHNPSQREESRTHRIISHKQWRQLILRDLGWLFNTGRLQTVCSLDAHEQVKSSVLNYGSPELTGVSIASLSKTELEQNIRQTIIQFEPRLIEQTLQVTVSTTERESALNAVWFVIEGELWSHPIPVQLYLKTEVDLDTGTVCVY